MENYNQPAQKSKRKMEPTPLGKPVLVKTPAAQIPNSFGFCLLKSAFNAAVDHYLTRRRARVFKRKGEVINNKNAEFVKPTLAGVKADFAKKEGVLTLTAKARQNFARVAICLGDFVAIQGYSSGGIKPFDKKALGHIEAAQIHIFSKLYENLPAILAGKSMQIVLTHQEFCSVLGISARRATPALLMIAKALANAELDLITQARKKDAEPQSVKGKMFASVGQGAGKKRGEIYLKINPQNAKVLRLLLQYKITAPEIIYDLNPRQQRLFMALARETRRNTRREQNGKGQKLSVKDLLEELGSAKALSQRHAEREVAALTEDLMKVLETLPVFDVVFYETTTIETNANGEEFEKPIPPKRIVDKGVLHFATRKPTRGDFVEIYKQTPKTLTTARVVTPESRPQVIPMPTPVIQMPAPPPPDPKTADFINSIEEIFYKFFAGDFAGGKNVANH